MEQRDHSSHRFLQLERPSSSMGRRAFRDRCAHVNCAAELVIPVVVVIVVVVAALVAANLLETALQLVDLLSGRIENREHRRFSCRLRLPALAGIQ
ncbi:MAG TPA: hypothetical protein VFI22_19120 [Thermomicrobiales bacterium]|nr:hypothetical protein [Thermomicrobiales bacterium]